MAMPPSAQAAYHSLLWEGLSPEQQAQRNLENARKQGDASGDYSGYHRLLWERLTPEQKNERNLENARKQYMDQYKQTDAYYQGMYGSTKAKYNTDKADAIKRSKAKIAAQRDM